MAKVEIEDRAFQDPELVSAASKHRVAKAVILGYAAVLWRMSQQARVIETDRETIIGWLDTDRFAKPKKAFDWLLSSGHLKSNADQTLFEIHGNSFRVPRISKRIENAKAAVTIREQKKSCIDPISDGSSKRYPDRETGRQVDKKTGKQEDIKTLSTVKPTKTRASPTYSETDLAVGSEWLEFAIGEMPWLAKTASWTPEAFAKSLAKLRRATDLNESGLAELLAFIKRDDFWRKNAASPGGLLKKSEKNGLRKIDNILVRMRTNTDRVAEAMKKFVNGGAA